MTKWDSIVADIQADQQIHIPRYLQNLHDVIRQVELLPDAIWVHCAGKDNPANLPSRGISLNQLATSNLWRRDQDWLTSGEPSVYVREEPTSDSRYASSPNKIEIIKIMDVRTWPHSNV